jgi:hypothetical protein
VRFVVHTLAEHVRERVANRYGARSFDPTTMEISALVAETFTTVEPLTQLVREIWATESSVA